MGANSPVAKWMPWPTATRFGWTSFGQANRLRIVLSNASMPTARQVFECVRLLHAGPYPGEIRALAAGRQPTPPARFATRSGTGLLRRRLVSDGMDGPCLYELLNGELFYTLYEAQVIIERWRRQIQHAASAQCAGVSATGPGNGCTAELPLGVAEFNGWPNSWGRVTTSQWICHLQKHNH